MQELQSLAKTVEDQTSYIKELEKKVDCLTVLVKKGEKPAEVATKKMETMASRLTALAATHPGSGSTTRNDLSSSQASQSICPRNEGIDGPGKAGPQKRSAGGPHLIVDFDKCESAQKELSCLEIRNSLQASLKAQAFTADVTLKGLNKDARKDHQYLVFFESSEDARKARIHDSWVTIQYPHARLFTGTTYPVKVHRVRISAVVNELTNTVHESTKKKIEEENGGLEITEVRWLSKPDGKKRYGSMLLRLADEQAANSLLGKGLLDVAGESYIVEEWEIQKTAERRYFKCQKFGHLATLCSGPIICGNCAEQGHSHRDCLNLRILCANCQGKHCANDRNCTAKPGFYLRSENSTQKETTYQHPLSQNYFINSQFPFGRNVSTKTPMFDMPAPPLVANE